VSECPVCRSQPCTCSGEAEEILRLALGGAEARQLGETVAKLSEAKTEEDIFAALAELEPPTDRMMRVFAREKLCRVLKGKLASPAKTVDAWLGTADTRDDGDELQGRRFDPGDVEPASEPVDGAQLLADIVSYQKRYSYMAEAQYAAAALWVVHSYCLDFLGLSPLLQVSSPTKRCGKSSLLVPLQRIAQRGLMTSNISPAALFRAVEAWKPSLFIDEGDTFVKLDESLRGVLNAGYTRDTAFTLRAEGDSHEPRMFSTWCAKAIAAIGRLPETVEDRSIRLVLHRKPTAIQTEDAFDPDDARSRGEPFRRRIARWVLDSAHAIAIATPDRPRGLDDRAWNNWKPLLAIAAVAGGDWPTEARKAAVELSAGRDSEEGYNVLALLHIREAFGDQERTSTDDLLRALVARDDGPWAKWWAKDVDDDRTKAPGARLARLLKDFDVAPKQIWLEGRKTRGYERADFEDAWSTYAESPDPPEKDGRNGRDGRPEVDEGASDQGPTVPTVPTVLSEGAAPSLSVTEITALLGAEIIDEREAEALEEELELHGQAECAADWNDHLKEEE
jgi:putative DNA primase/helicase